METFRRIAASYWTALALGSLTIFMHVRWYTVDKAAGAEVVSGLGAALVALGVFVGSRPYIRAGFAQLVADSLPRYDGAPFSTAERFQAYKDLLEQERPRVVRDVWAERIIAVAVVIAGTSLNGYGPLVSHLLHLRS